MKTFENTRRLQSKSIEEPISEYFSDDVFILTQICVFRVHFSTQYVQSGVIQSYICQRNHGHRSSHIVFSKPHHFKGSVANVTRCCLLSIILLPHIMECVKQRQRDLMLSVGKITLETKQLAILFTWEASFHFCNKPWYLISARLTCYPTPKPLLRVETINNILP